MIGFASEAVSAYLTNFQSSIIIRRPANSPCCFAPRLVVQPTRASA